MRKELSGSVMAVVTAGLVLAGLVPAQAQERQAGAHVPCNVPALIRAMNAATGGETLSLAPSCRYLLAAGLPVISQSLTIDGNHATLQRSTNPFVPKFTILQADGGALTINDLNFRNGDNAITVTGTLTTLAVNGGNFTGNSGTNGGAISQPDSGGNGPVVAGARFIANTASGNGGAIYDNVALEGVDLTDCTFIRNQAAGDGGGVFDFTSAGDEATDSRFYANRAANGGGGIFSANAGTLLSHVVARGNVAAHSGGGFGIGDSGVTVENSVIEGNQAGGAGGGIGSDGIRNDFTGDVIRGNTAADGGGIYADVQYELTLSGDLIAGNDASDDGGGVVSNGAEVATVAGTRIVRNAAGTDGGGIYVIEVEGITAFTLTTSEVHANRPDNCAPPGSVTGCPN